MGTPLRIVGIESNSGEGVILIASLTNMIEIKVSSSTDSFNL